MADDQSPAYLSLDVRGAIRGMKPKARALLDSYFSSDAAQSTMYLKGVSSIAKDIQVAGHDKSELSDKIRRSLYLLYGRYFFSVTLDVKVIEMEEDAGKWDIRVTMTLANESGESMNLAAISETESGLQWKTQWISEAQQ